MFAFHAITRGSSHILTDKPCQDCAASHYTKDYAIGIVADGHGSDRYFRSERGARFAVEITMTTLQELLSSTKNMKQLPKGDWQKQIATSIISRWNDRIEKDRSEATFTDNELSVLKDSDKQEIESGRWQFVYGTTLIAVVMTKDCYFGLQIGDGKCVAIDAAGKPQQPIPWDDRCFLNQTTSLCDNDAISIIRSVYTTNNLPVAVFAASDGVDDTYTTDERLYTFYQTLWKMLRDNPDKAVADLQDFLPKMSEQGSHDDISIAGVIRNPQSVWRRIFSKSKYN